MVLYVPEMKCNMLNLEQLLEKGYSTRMKENHRENLILKVCLSKNRTLKIGIIVLGHEYFTTATATEEEIVWKWHKRFKIKTWKLIKVIEKMVMMTKMLSKIKAEIEEVNDAGQRW